MITWFSTLISKSFCNLCQAMYPLFYVLAWLSCILYCLSFIVAGPTRTNATVVKAFRFISNKVLKSSILLFGKLLTGLLKAVYWLIMNLRVRR